uniref:VWFA domain-containing protein n=1 Tax=Thermosporothrix sp. COM3 TaxID=2490863 RepID=A0A455SD57_9CHLR|nr:hypothetical protein KTC_11340 [Thermosporothrix sp. COM3]
MTAASQTLVGIILDVSSSMHRNWQNEDGDKMPRVDVLLQILEKRIRALQQRHTQDEAEQSEQIEVFCLGMGFKTIMHTNEHDVSFQREHGMGPNAETKEVHHLVCDLLALAEIVPQKETLEELLAQLNQKWQSLAKHILDRSVIADDVRGHLTHYLQHDLYRTAKARLQKRLRYRLARSQSARLPNMLAKYLQRYVKDQEQKITDTSFKAAEKFVEDIIKSTQKTFQDKRAEYIELIHSKLEGFVHTFTSSILQKLSLGFSISELVDTLDEETALLLASQIQAELEIEVRKNIALIIQMHELQLRLAKQTIGARLDSRQIRMETERCIKKYGWDIIRPLIEHVIFTLFVDQFTAQIQQNLPYWIQLASMREVIRPIEQIPHLIPHIQAENTTADKIMAGGTPFTLALDKAALRFVDKVHQHKKKILIIISDGEFPHFEAADHTARLLKNRGITIISCLVAKNNVLDLSFKQSPNNWPVGAQQMLHISSFLTSEEAALHWQKSRAQLTDERLCVQINHSDIIEDVLDTVF